MDSADTAAHHRLSYFDAPLDLTPEQARHRRIRIYFCLILKIIIFFLMWLFFVVSFTIADQTPKDRVVAIDMKSSTFLNVKKKLKTNKIKVMLSGNFDKEMTNYPRLAKGSQKFLSIRVRIYNEKLNRTEWLSDKWFVYLIESTLSRSHIVDVKKYFKMKPNHARSPDIATISSDDNYKTQIVLVNPVDDIFALKVKINTNSTELQYGVIAAGILLCVLYAVLILDITDPPFAATLLASCAIGVLCLLDERPTLETIISWIDIHTLVLLFGMMIIAAIMSETGIFGYLSVLAYRLSRGRAWILVALLCLTSVVLSTFLELVTILMIMGPVVIRLCECMSLRTTTVLICVVIFSNIGSALTPIGDPPNVLIITNYHVMERGVDFSKFVIHMFPGVVLSIFAAWVYIYLMIGKRLKDSAEEQTNNPLRQLAKRMGEGQVQQTMRMAGGKYRRRKRSESSVFRVSVATNYVETLAMMEDNYKVHDKPLLIKSLVAFLLAVTLWTLHSLPIFSGAHISWTALMASMLLLIFYDAKDLTAVLRRIDWSMLLFFSALFILTEACSELGLIDFLAELTIKIIANVDPKYQVVTSIMLVLWLTFLLSLFIESIPIVTMLLKLTIQVALSERINIPLLPMIWALAYGVCFAGNGTLYATTGNVAAASIANQHGYKITFFEFFKFGFPVTIITTSIASIYLLIAYGIFNWY